MGIVNTGFIAKPFPILWHYITVKSSRVIQCVNTIKCKVQISNTFNTERNFLIFKICYITSVYQIKFMNSGGL